MGNLKDFATAIIAVAPAPATSGTELQVQTDKGSLYPATPFFAVAHPAGEMPELHNAEKVQVTDVAGDTLTIVREQGDTTAQPIGVGWRLTNAIFEEDFTFEQVQADWNATSGPSAILNKPTLGTAAAADTTDFATAAQGELADTAVQPDDLAPVATSGDYGDLDNLPTLGTAAAADTDDFATAAQGELADSALQPGDNITELNNNAGFTTNTGDVVGPGSATNTAIPVYGNTTGKLIANSLVVINSPTFVPTIRHNSSNQPIHYEGMRVGATFGYRKGTSIQFGTTNVDLSDPFTPIDASNGNINANIVPNGMGSDWDSMHQYFGRIYILSREDNTSNTVTINFAANFYIMHDGPNPNQLVIAPMETVELMFYKSQSTPTVLQYFKVIRRYAKNIQPQIDDMDTKLDGIEDGAQVNTVDSVNGMGGVVVLDPDDLDDATTVNKFTTAADISKLAGIEAGADVTDATNVAAAGAVMEADTSTAAMAFVVDEDDMASNSNTKVPTQQSVKAYVDALELQNGFMLQDGTEYATDYAYVGYEHADNRWYIYRRTRATNVRQYATGTSDYATNWADKESLSYA